MPNLNDILKKSRSKNTIKVIRKRPDVATDDRPYYMEKNSPTIENSSDSSLIQNIERDEPSLIDINLVEETSNKNTKGTQASGKPIPHVESYVEQSPCKEHNRNTNRTRQEHISDLTRERLSSKENESDIYYNHQVSKDADLEHIKNTSGTLPSNDTHPPLAPNNTSDASGTNTLDHNWNTSGARQEHLKNTYRTPSGNYSTTKNTIGTPLEHLVEHYKNTVGTHQEHKINPEFSLSYLTGIQNSLLEFFYQSCKKTRSQSTEKFALVNIANELNIRLGSIKNSLRRLEEKGFLIGTSHKKGRGGWTQFDLPNHIYRELLEQEKLGNLKLIGTHLEHSRNTYKDTMPPSSRSLKENKETTTNDLSPEWKFELSDYVKFGFRDLHLKQIFQDKKLKPEEVEESLIHFLYDLEHGHFSQEIRSKINYLMKILRGGNIYVSDVYNELMLAEAKANMDRVVKAKNERLEVEFSNWLMSLDFAEIENYYNEMPPHMISDLKSFLKVGLSLDPSTKSWLLNKFTQAEKQKFT